MFWSIIIIIIIIIIIVIIIIASAGQPGADIHRWGDKRGTTVFRMPDLAATEPFDPQGVFSSGDE